MSKYQNIKDKVIPLPERVCMGGDLKWLDEMLGGEKHPGMLVGGSVFLTGEPNAGKTTITFQMADALTGQGHRVKYYCPEMIESEMKMLMTRLNLKHGFDFVASDTLTPEEAALSKEERLLKILNGSAEGDLSPDLELATDFIKACEQREGERIAYNDQLRTDTVEYQDYMLQRLINPYLPEIKRDEGRVVLFVDSIQALSNGRSDAFKTLQRFVKLNQVLGGVVVFIGQATKSGKFAGNNEMVHEVTTHLHGSVITNADDEQVREYETKKNRGGVCTYRWTRLTDKGHVNIPVVHEEER